MGQIKWKPEYEFLTPVEVKTGTDNVIAWMPLPEPYKEVTE